MRCARPGSLGFAAALAYYYAMAFIMRYAAWS
jgi:hypothetical protein